MSKFPQSIRNKLVGPTQTPHILPVSDRKGSLFSIASLQHAVLKELHGLRRSPKNRQTAFFVRDGHLIRRLISRGHRPTRVVVPGENIYWASEAFKETGDLKLHTAPRHLLEHLCFGGNFHRGEFRDDAHLVCASFCLPEKSQRQEIPTHPGNWLVLDSVQNPTNAGVLAATAAALNFRGIFPINGTCDLYDHKSVYSSNGAVLDIPIFGKTTDIFEFAARRKLLPVVAHVEGVQPEKLDVRKYAGVMLIVGNEGHGPREEIVKLAARVKIPMAHAVESLNVAVAGGILMNIFSQCEIRH